MFQSTIIQKIKAAFDIPVVDLRELLGNAPAADPEHQQTTPLAKLFTEEVRNLQ